jgi:hypothetical protein
MKIISHREMREEEKEFNGETFVQTWFEPAVGRCDCGRKVVMSDPMDNVCDGCGRCFNSGGTEVIPTWECDDQGEPLAWREDF